MDTGSMTNWIARALLEFITYSTKGHIMLEVITMTGRERKRFELVEVSYNGKQKANSLICYVYDGFTEHVTVGGLPQLLQGQSTLSKEQYVAIVDPASTAVDHADLSLGIGLIMCPASISKILSGPIMHFNEVNLSLNPTIFGLAISGEVPRNLKDKVKTITNQCTIALPVCNHGTVPKLAKKLTEPLPKTESHKEKEFIDNGHQVSIAINSTKLVSPLAPVVSPMHFMLFIGALMLASAYSNVLGCYWDSVSNYFYSDLFIIRLGSEASPFQLIAIIYVLLRDDYEALYFILLYLLYLFYFNKILWICMYIDEVVSSSNYERRLHEICKYSRHTFKSGNLELKQWTSIGKLLIQKTSLDVIKIVKVLGIKCMSVNIELSTLVVSLTELLSMTNTPFEALAYKLSLIGLDQPWQALITLNPSGISFPQKQSLVTGLALPCIDQSLQKVLTEPHTFNKGNDIPSTTMGTVSYMQPILHPDCIYSSSEKKDCLGASSIPIWLYVAKLFACIACLACLVLIALSEQFRGVGEVVFCPSFFTLLIYLAVLLVVSSKKTSPWVLKWLKLGSSSQCVSGVDLKFVLFPIFLFFDCFPLTMVMPPVTWGFGIIISNAVQLFMNILPHNCSSIAIAAELAVIGFDHLPALIGVGLNFHAYSICGILAMCLDTLLPFFTSLQRYENDIKHLVIGLNPGCIVTLLQLLVLSTTCQIAPLIIWAKQLKDDSYKLYLRISPISLWLHLKETFRIGGSEKVITPSSILMKFSVTDVDILQVTNKEDDMSNSVLKVILTPQLPKDTRRCREVFWTHFRQQCLESTKFHHMSAEESPGLTLQVGEILVMFDNPHKLFWSKVLESELLLSRDGLIKKAVVKVLPFHLTAGSEPDEVN